MKIVEDFGLKLAYRVMLMSTIRFVSPRGQANTLTFGPGMSYFYNFRSGNITFVTPSAFSRRAVVSYWRKYVHEVLVNRLGGLSLPRKSVVRLTDRPDMTLDVYRGRKTTMQQQQQSTISCPQ